LPGCDKLERTGDQFLGEINVKMGPVQGKFQGKVDIQNVKDHESYTMVVDGRGPAGFAKATANIRVKSEGVATRLDYDSDVQVGGRIASVGQRLLDASSRAIVKQSLEGLHEQLKALAARSAPPPAPGAAAAPAAVSAAAAAPAAVSAAGAAPAAVAASASAVASAAAPAPAARPPVAAPRAPSQAAFALGVAKEVTKEILPSKGVAVALVLVGMVLGVLLCRALSG
jgi:uncharacterized protein